MAAVIGHAFPFLLGFRGGKAVATGAGAMMALVPWIGVTVFVIWILVGLVTRYVSVASIAAALSYSALCVIAGQPWAITAFTFGRPGSCSGGTGRTSPGCGPAPRTA